MSWRLIVKRFMHTFRLVPDAVERPPDLALGQRRVAAAVDLLGLVVAEEALDVGFVIGTLDARVLQRDAEGFEVQSFKGTGYTTLTSRTSDQLARAPLRRN